MNPAVRRAAELISSGKIGRPLSASLLSTTVGFGPEMPSTHDLFNKTFPEPTCASLFRDSCRRRAQAFNQLYLELKTEMASAAMKDLSTGAEPREQLLHLWQHWMNWALSYPEKRRALAQLGVSEPSQLLHQVRKASCFTGLVTTDALLLTESIISEIVGQEET